MLTQSNGAGPATLKEVLNTPAPIRETPTYQPVSNKELLDMLHRVAKEQSLVLKEPQFGLARYGQRMFGVYKVEGQEHFDGRVKLMLGVRNSGDGQIAAGVCFGSEVFVCSNLVFTGYANESDGIVGRVSHKHTINVMDTLYERLSSALNQFPVFRDFQENFYGRLTDRRISDNRAFATIVKAVMDDVIPNKDVIRLANIWLSQKEEPKETVERKDWHPEFQSRNAYSLFNAFTHLHKGYQKQNPVEAVKRSIRLTQLFHHEFSRN